MKVVLDTNVFLVCISKRSKLHWVFDALLKGRYTLCVTTDILAEYAEIIESHMGLLAADNALGALENLPNIDFITTYFRFPFLNDPDDNKFVECAIAANARFIVSHDSDFKVLKTINFPKVEVIDTNAFYKELFPDV
jgi:uncharacterized protein